MSLIKRYFANETEYFMSDISSFYDEICRPCSENRITFLESILKGVADDNVLFLDASCSTGETICRLANICKGEYYGSDISEGMIKRAEEKNLQANTHFIKCDMQNIAISTLPKMDFVYTNSIEWLSDSVCIERAIESMYEVLKEKGFLILDIVNEKKFVKKLRTYYSTYVLKNNTLYTKSTYYQEKVCGFLVNQIYMITSLKKREVSAISGEFFYTPLTLTFLNEVLNDKFKIVKIVENYGCCGDDNYQILCEKMEKK